MTPQRAIGFDWVRIDGETEFCLKYGRLTYEIGYDERDLRHVYDLLQKREPT